MIKNKILDIKFIFKTYLEILKTDKIFQVFKQFFVLQKLKNNFQKLFSKTNFHHCFKK